MSKEKHLKGISVLIIALAAIFIMCSGYFETLVPATPPNTNVRVSDNYLYVGMQDEPKSLNPTIPNDVWSTNFLSWMWDGCLAQDPDDQSYQPWIATDWKMNTADNMNFTVHYRFAPYTYVQDSTGALVNKPIKFHDGTEVTIYDLLFSFELALGVPRWGTAFEALDKTPNGTVMPPGGTYAIHLIKGVSMDTDPAMATHTLHFKLNRTDATWEADFVSMTIYPYHVWADKFYSGQFYTWNIENEANPAQYEIGSGPFKYNTWAKGGQYAQLDTYTDYFPWNKMPRDSSGNPPPALVGKSWWWEVKKSPITVDPSQSVWGSREARPYIDGIKYEIYYSVDTATLALQNGDVDVNWWTVDPGYIPSMSSNSNVQLVTSDDTGFFYLAFNMRKPAFGYDDWNSPTRVDQGKLLRQVFEMCTDKDTIVKRLLANYGTAGTSVVSPSNTQWYNPYVPTYPFDPQGAMKLLQDAGYKKDPNGFFNLGSPYGSDPINLIHPTKDYDSVRYEAARMVVDQLVSIGINVKSEPLEFGQITTLIDQRNFDVYILGWQLGTDPGYMYDFFDSSQAGQGLSNYPGYHNDSYDKLVEQSRSELNLSKRRDLIKQCQVTIAQDVPYDVLYYRSNIQAYRKDRWAGWISTIGGIMNGWSFNFIKKPAQYMNVEFQRPPIMTSDHQATINVKVTSAKTLLPQANANVTIRATSLGNNPGKFDVNNWANATTDSAGIAAFTYHAPTVNATEINRTIQLQATVSCSGYELSLGFDSIKIYAPNIIYWVATIDVATSTLNIKKGETGTLRMYVNDQNAQGVPGVVVQFSVEPATGLTLSTKQATTNSAGSIVITFTATLANNYTITAEPQKTGNVSDAVADQTTATVLSSSSPSSPVSMTLYIIIIVIVVIVVVIAVVAMMVMRKKSAI